MQNHSCPHLILLCLWLLLCLCSGPCSQPTSLLEVMWVSGGSGAKTALTGKMKGKLKIAAVALLLGKEELDLVKDVVIGSKKSGL